MFQIKIMSSTFFFFVLSNSPVPFYGFVLITPSFNSHSTLTFLFLLQFWLICTLAIKVLDDYL